MLGWEKCCLTIGKVKEERQRETERLAANHTFIYFHKSISLWHACDSLVSTLCLVFPSFFYFFPLFLSLSPHEANPIHCNIIRASPCYLDSLPEPKRHTQGQIDFPVALDLWQSSRNRIAQPPTSPHLFLIYTDTDTNSRLFTRTHLVLLTSVSKAIQSVLRIFFSFRETCGTRQAAIHLSAGTVEGWGERRNTSFCHELWAVGERWSHLRKCKVHFSLFWIATHTPVMYSSRWNVLKTKFS